VWITRAPFSHTPQEQQQTYERGTYHVFDPSRWTKVPKEMTLEYSKLEERPPFINQSANGLFLCWLYSFCVSCLVPSGSFSTSLAPPPPLPSGGSGGSYQQHLHMQQMHMQRGIVVYLLKLFANYCMLGSSLKRQ
jgi:hypothetical protein